MSTFSWLTSNEDFSWGRVILAIAVVILSTIFRHKLVIFALRIVRKILPSGRASYPHIWLSDIERHVSQPLSYLVLFSLYNAAIVIMRWNTSTVSKICLAFIGIPLIWTVVRLFVVITLVIVRSQGWTKGASGKGITSSSNADDSSRIVIVTEGIGLIKYIVVSILVFVIYLNTFWSESGKVIVVTLISLQLVIVLASYTWIKNIVGGLILISEAPIAIGSVIRILGHEGTIVRISLRRFVMRRLDKALVYIPNGKLLDSSIEILDPELKWKLVIAVNFDPASKVDKIREFVQEADLLIGSDVMSASSSSSLGSSSSFNMMDGMYHHNSSLGSRNNNNIVSSRKLRKLLSSAAKNKNGTTANGTNTTTTDNKRYWVSMEGVNLVNITYYTEKANYSEFIQEKSDVLLAVTRLIEQLELKVKVDDEESNDID